MAAPLPSHRRHTRRRRAIQAAFLLVFALLPLFDLLRFDFRAATLHVFRQQIGLDEWALLWLVLMFSMWVIGAASLLFGRVWCAYACPQTLFTELVHDIEGVAARLVRPLPPARRRAAARWATLGATFVLSVAASALFMAYFAPLPDVLARLARLDVGPWVGAVGFATTVLVYLDLAYVKETFCRTACPYGLLQGVIEDGRSLHVRYDQSTGPCIDCGACVRQCPMGIDIREGSFQIDCTRCGTCIDACDTVLARLKEPRPGLLAFDFAGIMRGGWDGKRILVSLATAGFGVAMVAGIALREPVRLHVSPVYTAAPADGDWAEAKALLRAANRTRAPLTLEVHTEGLPGSGAVSGLEQATLAPGEERRFTLVVRVPARDVKSGVTPFRWVVETERGAQQFAASLLARRRQG